MHRVRQHLRVSVGALTAHFGMATRIAACRQAMPPAPRTEHWETANTASRSAQRWSWLAPAERRREARMGLLGTAARLSTMLRLQAATLTPSDTGGATPLTVVGFHLGDPGDLWRDPVMFPLPDAWRVLQHLAPTASWGWHDGRLEAHNTRASMAVAIPAVITPVLTGEGWLYPTRLDHTAWDVVDLDALRRREATAAAFAQLPLDDDF
jgi:hypothetical protein